MKTGTSTKNLPGVEVRSNSIRISFTTPDGVRHKKTYKVAGAVMAPNGPNLNAAFRMVQAIKAEIRLGVFDMARHFPDDAEVLMAEAVDESKSRTVAEQLDVWMGTVIVAQSTAQGYESAIRFWKQAPALLPLKGQSLKDMPRLGDLRICDLVQSNVKAALKTKENRSGKTTNNYVSVLKQALDLAVSDRLIPEHPVVGKPVRRKWQSGTPDPFSKKEIASIVDDMSSQYPEQVAAMCEFWFLTGLRTSELYGLRWQSVDLDRKVIRIHEALVRGKPKASTKTNKDRSVKLPQRAVDLLVAQQARTLARGEYVWDDPNNEGGPWMDEKPFRRTYWIPTLKRLGIRYRRPYQCRHTNATMRLMAGQRLAYAAQQMGHTVDMFVHTYARWINDGHSALEDEKFEDFLALQVPAEVNRPADRV